MEKTMRIISKVMMSVGVFCLIFGSLANLNTAYAYPTSFTYEAENMPTVVGGAYHYAGSPGLDVMRATTSGSTEGYMLYGPYATDQLPGKRYRVAFKTRVLGEGTSDPVARLELYNYGNELLADRDIYVDDFAAVNTFEDLTMDFTATDIGSMEYRVWFYDQVGVEVDKIVVAETPPVDSIKYESEFLRRAIGTRIADGTASNGKAVLATAAEGANYMQFGPYTNDQDINNTFKATYRLKVSNNTSSAIVARIDAANSHGSGEWTYKDIKGTDFAAPNTYQDFSVIHQRINEGTMEYRIFAYSVTDITADYVQVDKVTQSTNSYESENLDSEFIGSTVPDIQASGGEARMAGGADVGYLQYGPYTVDQSISQNYEAIFRLSVADHTTSTLVARIEAANHGGDGDWRWKNIYANDFSASNKYEEFSLPFTRNVGGTMEYRVYALGSGISFKADKVDVYKTVVNDWVYESEDSYGAIGGKAYDSQASGNFPNNTREATVTSDNQGYVVYGPYSDDQPANNAYTATFRLKTRDNSSSEKIARIEVYNPFKETPLLAFKELKGTDFAANDTWQDFGLNFNRLAGGNLEFRVWFFDVADILSDKVSITEFNNNSVTYEAENMYIGAGIGQVITDANASDNQAVQATKDNALCGVFPGSCYVVYGPYTVDQDQGNYEAVFRIKRGFVPGPGDPLARVEVVNNGGTGEFKTQTLYITDFNGEDYTDITLNFYRTGDGNMEYRVYSFNNADITVDKVTVNKI
ncbi:hypothetical protein KJ855_04245 [Patescibacteria group bacterium]|nr:hypothetical protein [Patescibacteria group bacterium]